MAATRRRGVHSRKIYAHLIQQILAPFDVWSSGPGQFRSKCPIHRGDNPTAFHISIYGRWRCYRCGAHGDMAALVMRMNRVPFLEARKLLEEFPSLWVDISSLPTLPDWKDRHKSKSAYPVLKESAIAAYRGKCPVSLINRGFSASVLRLFEIGYDRESFRVVLPIRDVHGRLVGITYRLDFSITNEPKYRHDNFDKRLHLYGFHLVARKRVKRLFLVEGQLDAVRMHQLGHAAAAVMGSSISAEQVALLVKYAACDSIVLAFDNDEAGEAATRRAVKALAGTRLGRKMQVAKYPGKDPGDLDIHSRIILKHWAGALFT